MCSQTRILMRVPPFCPRPFLQFVSSCRISSSVAFLSHTPNEKKVLILELFATNNYNQDEHSLIFFADSLVESLPVRQLTSVSHTGDFSTHKKQVPLNAKKMSFDKLTKKAIEVIKILAGLLGAVEIVVVDGVAVLLA